jgi:hypothetical protein
VIPSAWTVSGILTDSDGFRYFTAEYLADWVKMTEVDIEEVGYYASSQFEIVKELPTGVISCAVLTWPGPLPSGATPQIHEQFYNEAKAACQTISAEVPEVNDPDQP